MAGTELEGMWASTQTLSEGRGCTIYHATELYFNPALILIWQMVETVKSLTYFIISVLWGIGKIGQN